MTDEEWQNADELPFDIMLDPDDPVVVAWRWVNEGESAIALLAEGSTVGLSDGFQLRFSGVWHV